MKPHPPVTRIRTVGPILFRRDEAFEARAEAFAPVGEARRIFALAAKDGVGRSRRGAAELLGRDRHDTAFHPGLGEDRLCELGPCALAFGRDVPDPLRSDDDLPAPQRRDARRRSGSRVGHRPPSLRPVPVRARALCGRSSYRSARRATSSARSNPRRAPAHPRAWSFRTRSAAAARRTRHTALACARQRRSPSRSTRPGRRARRHSACPRRSHGARRPGRSRRHRHPSRRQRGARAPARARSLR